VDRGGWIGFSSGTPDWLAVDFPPPSWAKVAGQRDQNCRIEVWFMKKVLFLLSVGLVALLGACDRPPEKASARERRLDAKPPPKVEVTRWKQTGFDGRLYGIIVEQEGNHISANLYALEDGEGLVIREKESQGKYFADKKAILFPLYNPAAVSVEKWIAEGGPHIIVPWEPGASTLTGTLKDSSRTNAYAFRRLDSVTPTYLNGASPEK
jgi:hypothetical protein